MLFRSGTKIADFSELSYSDAIESENSDLLVEVMSFAGFTQLPTEWWHFSYGDQIWALETTDKTSLHVEAKYGMI